MSHTSGTVSNYLPHGVVPFSQKDGVTRLPIERAGCSGCESIAWMLL